VIKWLYPNKECINFNRKGLSFYEKTLSSILNSKRKELRYHLMFYFFSVIEILSYYIPYLGTFDFKDILGLFIGAILLFVFLKKNE